MEKLKVVFMGTPDFSVPVLEALISNYDVVLVVTQPDRTKKDGKIIVSPIKQVALDHNIKLFQPERLKENYEEIINTKADIIITCAYGQILPKILLDFPSLGCINVHASLLPKLRGGAPIHWAIINGYSKTGITIMYMDERMDEGNIIKQKEVNIELDDNVGTLHDRLSIVGRDLLLEVLPLIISGEMTEELATKQDDSKATYGNNIKREDEKVDFSKSMKAIYNQVRGLNPWPGAYGVLEGKIIKIWNSRIGDSGYSIKLPGEITNIYDDGIGVRVSDGEIILTEIQMAGRKKMLVKDYLNGLQEKEILIGKIFE